VPGDPSHRRPQEARAVAIGAILCPIQMAANGVSTAEQPPSRGLIDPYSERLLRDARERTPRRLTSRERSVELVASAGFLAAAIGLLLVGHSGNSPSLGVAVALVLAYALASQIRFEIGAGYTDPSQLLFVPMLFLLPTEAVPLLVAGANVLAELPDYLRGRRHPERAVFALGDSWHAVGPAAVLLIAGTGNADPADWPIYVLALAAQFGFDFAANGIREWLEIGVGLRQHVADSAWVYAVDTLLSPIGFIAVLAEPAYRYVFLLLLPLAGLLAIFAHERQSRFVAALELSEAYQGSARLLAHLVEHDDTYTGVHSRDVVDLAVRVSDEIDLDSRRRRNLELAALLHDAGKIAVSKDIINKPGALTEDEWALVRRHTLDGQRMLDEVGGLLGEVGTIVRSTHERWDGTGYPDGLAATQIPIEARIIACCDAFNAITTERSYRRARPVPAALSELEVNAGSQFDPEIATIVVRLVRSELAAARR
jgi:hypothetical protein